MRIKAKQLLINMCVICEDSYLSYNSYPISQDAADNYIETLKNAEYSISSILYSDKYCFQTYIFTYNNQISPYLTESPFKYETYFSISSSGVSYGIIFNIPSLFIILYNFAQLCASSYTSVGTLSPNKI